MSDEPSDMTDKSPLPPQAEPASQVAPETSPVPPTLYQQLLFGLSLPERAVRSTTALVGGTLQEATLLLIPPAFRSSRSYTMFIQQSLDFLLTEVGNVERADSAAAAQKDLIARKAVGGFLDLAGVATLHLSPMTVLALVSDIAYGSSAYLKELSDELKKVGVIDQHTTIDHATDLLAAIQHASSVSSQALDAPPLSVDGLRETIAQTTQAVQGIDPTKLLPQSELQRMWCEIRDIAGKEGVSPFEVSSTLALHAASKVGTLGQGALSSVTVAGNMFDRHILDHYRTGLDAIRQQGLFSMLATTSLPYTTAVWANFSSSKVTITEDLLSGRLLSRAWGSVSAWWKKPSELNES